MSQIRLLAVAAVVALLLSLVALVPVRVGFAALGLPAEAASGLSGTVWQGSAQRVSAGGFTLGPVRWNVKASRLLVGQLAAGIEATLPDGFLNGTVAVGLGGGIAFSNLEAATPLAWLVPAAGTGGGQVAGRFEKLAVREGRIQTAIGKLKVAGIVLPIPTNGPPLPPGTYEVAFAAADLKKDQLLTGVLTDAGGPVEIVATLTITPPRAYELTGTAKPRPEAPPELRNALQMLGPATPDGGHALSLAGTF